VRRQTSLPRAGPDLFKHRQRSHHATRHIVRVLETDQRSLCPVINFRADGCAYPVPRQHASLARNRPRLAAGERRHHRHLPIQNVRARLADGLLPVLRVQAHGNLVSHGSGRHEDSGLAPEYLGRACLQPIHRRVLAINIIADLCLCHGAPHGGCRPGNGIAAQIDH
jgi:hypothetical protein